MRWGMSSIDPMVRATDYSKSVNTGRKNTPEDDKAVHELQGRMGLVPL